MSWGWLEIRDTPLVVTTKILKQTLGYYQVFECA
jgi:hypothetical protein